MRLVGKLELASGWCMVAKHVPGVENELAGRIWRWPRREVAQKVSRIVGSGWTKSNLGEKGLQIFNTIPASVGEERAPDDKIWRNALRPPFPDSHPSNTPPSGTGYNIHSTRRYSTPNTLPSPPPNKTPDVIQVYVCAVHGGADGARGGSGVVGDLLSCDIALRAITINTTMKNVPKQLECLVRLPAGSS